MIDRIEPLGMFIEDTSVAGERRSDGAYPAMGDVVQLSQDRWLVVFSTRGFHGIDQGFTGSDNDRSILWQLRDAAPTGRVIREGIFARYVEDWDVLNDGRRSLKQHCHTGAFGVPKGALLSGKRVPHENVFAASWYRTPRGKGADGATRASDQYEQALQHFGFQIEWTQFKLSDAGDDIEILQPAQQLRQKGFDEGFVFCDMVPPCRMNKWYVKPAPCNDDMSQWVQVPHFEYGIAPIRFQFSPQTGLYEWVQTGPLFSTGRQDGITNDRTDYQLTETTLIRHKDDWLILARTAERTSMTVRGVAWFRTDDLFKPLPEPTFPRTPLSKSPCSAFRCPDGALRVLTNDVDLSPYKNDRNPLYCWDVDPDDGFQTCKPRVLFDCEKTDLRVRDETWFRVDMPNLFPHSGGREQIAICRVRLRSRKHPFTRLVDEERKRTGMYHSRIIYTEDHPSAWQFE